MQRLPGVKLCLRASESPTSVYRVFDFMSPVWLPSACFVLQGGAGGYEPCEWAAGRWCLAVRVLNSAGVHPTAAAGASVGAAWLVGMLLQYVRVRSLSAEHARGIVARPTRDVASWGVAGVHSCSMKREG